MARPRNGTSAHTHYRRARENLAALLNEHEKVARSRPRTSGKKGAKTHALNKLARQLRAARGLVTKARNAIAKGASQRVATKRQTSKKRSEAARKGWETRRARTGPPAPPSSLGLFMPHLTLNGPEYIHPVGSDRSLESAWWVQAIRFLDNKPDVLDLFAGQSVLDTATGKRMPFITDRDVIRYYQDTFDFGPSFYKRRNEARGLAA